MLIGQKIIVLGAGIAGLAVSIALARRGARVEVLEQADRIEEVGAGLQISPNGLAVLEALGVAGTLEHVSVRARSVTLREHRHGRQVLRLDLAEYAPDQKFLLVHRADLIATLEGVAHQAGVTILTGQKALRALPGPVPCVTLASGERREASLVIGADGLHSIIRPLLNPGAEPFFTGQVAWRALVRGDPATLKPEVQVYMGPGRHIVTYPLRGGRLINIVAVEERDEWAEEGWSQTGDPDALRRAFSGFAPEMQTLLAQVEIVNLWGLFRHPVARGWGRDGLALAGDAAHPTLPFLAQGANLALEDAWVLAETLAALEPEDALQAYQLQRRQRAEKVIEAANSNARNYHLRHPLVRLVAHSALRLTGAAFPSLSLRQFDWIYRHDVTKV